ncbi:hypothetical protein ACHAW5_005098 [Stephanodiscus triporus]|uniref:Peptidase A1 domain-containing protein n=1 Tax=Stephanodiscus triporus TaxID=2934178 RepID=A0ABD3PYK8_9STRA
MGGPRHKRALTRHPFFTIAILRCYFGCGATRDGGILFVNAAFIREYRCFVSRGGPPHRALLDLTNKLSKTGKRRIGDDDGSNVAETDLPDRRSFLAFLTYGAGTATSGDAAFGYFLEPTRQSHDHDDLQSGDREKDAAPTTVTLPLEPASGGTFCVRLTVFPFEEVSRYASIFGGRSRNIEAFRLFRAIVDTGSPYLVLPSSDADDDEKEILPWKGAALASDSTRNIRGSTWLSKSACAPPTEEIYGSVKGQIDWKFARYAFRDPILQVRSNYNPESQCPSISSLDATMTNAAGVVGVMDDVLTNESTGGGMIESYALLGLIRDHNSNADRNRFPDPRPSFLEQEYISIGKNDNTAENKEHRIRSFTINGPLRELTLSTQSLIPAAEPVLPLVDLRIFGDFVDHYAVVVDSISLGGVLVSSQSLKQFSGHSIERPIVAVFDTGLTSCLLIRPFWDVLQKYLEAQRATVDEIRSVSLSLKQVGGQKLGRGIPACKIFSSIEVDPHFYVKPIELDWFDDERYSPYVIVLGQSFLSQGALTIDLDKRIGMFNLASA